MSLCLNPYGECSSETAPSVLVNAINTKVHVLTHQDSETGPFSVVPGMRGSRGGHGVEERSPNPLKNQTAIYFLSNTGHPWKSQNFQASIQRPMALWHFAGGPMMVQHLTLCDFPGVPEQYY